MKKLNEIRVGILKIPITRILLLVVTDMVAVMASSALSLYVRYEFSFMSIEPQFWKAIQDAYLLNVFVTLIIFYIFRLYNSVWRYASDTEMVNVVIAVTICSIMQPVIFWLLGTYVPRSFPFFYGFFMAIFTGGVRFSYRFLRMVQNKRLNHFNTPERQNYMIVGAGASGNAILQEVQSSKYLSMHVACFIDDNPGCQGKYLRGVPIVGGREKIAESVEKYDVDEIIIAIPSASRSELKPLLEICKETGRRIQILPGMYQIIKGDVNVSNLREVQIEDLLGRDPIEVNVDEIIGYVRDKVVLVTGGGGSIGSELCRQVARHSPRRLVILDIYENNAYEIQQELRRDYPELDLEVKSHKTR